MNIIEQMKVPVGVGNNQKEKMNVSGRQKKTKETMKLEPLPLFDCMYCVKDSKFVFQSVSET
jgi:hypothetical protein